MLQDVAEKEGIIVIGTVKKLDDLRKACRDKNFPLRFEEILHDEFVRQQWLDFFTIAKLAKDPCQYQAIGDQMQTKCIPNNDIFQQKNETCVASMTNYRASVYIQKDLWKSYTDFCNVKKKLPGGTQVVRENLKKCTERADRIRGRTVPASEGSEKRVVI